MLHEAESFLNLLHWNLNVEVFAEHGEFTLAHSLHFTLVVEQNAILYLLPRVKGVDLAVGVVDVLLQSWLVLLRLLRRRVILGALWVDKRRVREQEVLLGAVLVG